MEKAVFLLCLMLSLASCKKHDADEKEPVNPAQEKTIEEGEIRRTVIVYMSGENNLSSYVNDDVSEMVSGANGISQQDRLVVYVDRATSAEKPYIIRIKDNGCDTLNIYAEDFYSSDPDKFREVIEHIEQSFPSEEYALVLWGHATGWLVRNDSIAQTMSNTSRKRAYGVDNGTNNSYGFGEKWMNITQMARALNGLPKFKYIFADCCCMLCAEVAYELRNTADFLIGSPAEIPGMGAPYQLLVKDLFSTEDDFYEMIVDTYYNYYLAEYKTSTYANSEANKYMTGGSVPLAAVKSVMMDSLAEATREVLPMMYDYDFTGIPFYYCEDFPVMYDISVMLQNHLPEEVYLAWRQVMDKAIVYKRFAKSWMTMNSEQRRQFVNDAFNFDETNFSGLSMFFPRAEYNFSPLYDYNNRIRNFEWYHAVGWPEMGSSTQDGE